MSKEFLHNPARAARLDTLEVHMGAAANLARALWIALYGGSYDAGDIRDRDALSEIASAVADHATAAVYVREKKAVEKLMRKAAEMQV